MKIALLGTGFGRAHAAVYAERSDVDEVVVFGRSADKLAKISDEFGFATTTDLDVLIADPTVDLVDICLPTELHAATAIRAMRTGHDVLIELPLATTMDDARHIVDVQQATGRRAFVDMFSRFSAANQYLHTAVTEQRNGPLLSLDIEGRTALLWEGYDLGLDSLALDMMHGAFDVATSLLGPPDDVFVSGIPGPQNRGSAAQVLLEYPAALARCTASALMPAPYGVRGGYRATFTDAVLEHTMHAGYTGQATGILTEWTDNGERVIDLPDISPYPQMIDHVLACLNGTAENRIEPASALTALQLTLDVHHKLNNDTESRTGR